MAGIAEAQITDYIAKTDFGISTQHLIVKDVYSNHKNVFKIDGTLDFGTLNGYHAYSGFTWADTPNSINNQLHPVARRGIRSTAYDPTALVARPIFIFTDGGLNVQSYAVYSGVTGYRLNNVGIRFYIDIPYHNYDVQFTFNWSLTRAGVPVTLTNADTPILYNYDISSRGQQSKELIISIVGSNKIQAQDELTFSFQTYNKEGTFSDWTSRSFTIQPALFSWTYSGAYASYARDYPTATYSIRSASFPIYDGMTLYLNDTMTSPIASGYYADTERWYQVNSSGTIIASGYFGYWPAGDPLNPSPTTPINHYGVRNNTVNIVGYLSGINYSAGTGWDSTVTIYKDVNNKYCVDSNGTSWVSNGYYAFPYGGGDSYTLLGNKIVVVNRIVSGAITEVWWYDTIDSTFIQQ